MELDPLYKVKLLYLDNQISNKLYNLIFKGFAIVKEGINRIEDITNIAKDSKFIKVLESAEERYNKNFSNFKKLSRKT